MVQELFCLNKRIGIEFFQRHSGRCIHIIDPFKVPPEEVVLKAITLEELGAPFLLLGSTDYEDFGSVMASLVARIREKVSVPIVSHFPPLRRGGLPFVRGIDVIIAPAVLTSENPQFVWKSLLETYREFGKAEAKGESVPNAMLSAAFTFGEDPKSRRYMDTHSISQSEASGEELARIVRHFGFHFVYLYSRNSKIELSLVRLVRQRLDRKIQLFVGGGVKSRVDVDRYIDAGADYVVFGASGERNEWREVFEKLITDSKSTVGHIYG